MTPTESHTIVICTLILFSGFIGWLAGFCHDTEDSQVDFWFVFVPVLVMLVVAATLLWNVGRLVFLNF